MDPAELGRRVSQKRKDLGISQETLAQNADISRNYLSLIERGEARNVTLNVLTNLSTALGFTPGELMGLPETDVTLISPTLREFARKEGLSFDIVDKLSRLPRRGHEPKTAEEWRTLYRTIRKYL